MSARSLAGSMAVIGGAQLLKVLVSLVRAKVLAVLLGPVGIGILGLYNSLQQTATQLAGFGIITSGVRELSASREDPAGIARARAALIAAHWGQGAVAAAVIWLLRARIAGFLFGSPDLSFEVGLTGIAVLLALLSQMQVIQLQGLRDISGLARSTVLGAVGGTVVGLAAVLALGTDGLIWFVIAQPLAVVLVAMRYTRRLPGHRGGASVMPVVRLWGRMARAGVAMMLEPMTADYYPRLSGIIHDRAAATRLMNAQIQLGLAVGGPLLLLLIGLAPMVVGLLYSGSFGPAATLLQWQCTGNLLKLCCWPLIFALAASGRSVSFLAAQFSFGSVFLLLVWSQIGRVGLDIAGIGFLAGYLAQFALLCILLHRQAFRWERASLSLLALFVACSAAVLALSLRQPSAGAVAGVAAAAVTGGYSLRVFAGNPDASGGIGARIARGWAVLGWPIEAGK